MPKYAVVVEVVKHGHAVLVAFCVVRLMPLPLSGVRPVGEAVPNWSPIAPEEAFASVITGGPDVFDLCGEKGGCELDTCLRF